MELRAKQEADGSLSEVSCAHNGYYWLPGEPVHRRTWWMNEGGLTINDLVEGPHGDAEARFHFHPEVQVQIKPNKTTGTALLPNGAVVTWRIGHGEGRLEPSTWHPRFGAALSTSCLTVRLKQGTSTVRFCWTNSVA
jgi:hypothetical protein